MLGVEKMVKKLQAISGYGEGVRGGRGSDWATLMLARHSVHHQVTRPWEGWPCRVQEEDRHLPNTQGLF